MQLAKARYYDGADSATSILATAIAADTERLYKRPKTIVYIAGGASYSEVVAATASDPPNRIGFFSQGASLAGRTSILVADGWRSGSGYLREIIKSTQQ